MGMVCPELSLDLKPTVSYVPETINGFLKQVGMIGDVSQRVDKVDDFVGRLEDEMSKIQVFHRELPLCMLLLKDAILVLKQETAQYRTRNAHQPVLEEFIPLKKESGRSGNTAQIKESDDEDKEELGRDKKNWMSSVQLWTADHLPTKAAAAAAPNQTHNLVPISPKGGIKKNNIVDDDLHVCKSSVGLKGFPGMLHTYPAVTELRSKVEKEDATVAGLSLVPLTVSHHPDDQGSIARDLTPPLEGTRISNPNPSTAIRKQRRCWSPELHRRFVEALTQLGGANVATPKQIRELMRVDGLTNDEVKSHLQKYRLHTRRVSHNSTASTNGNGNGSWGTQSQYSDSSKPSTSQSGSPEGPLQFPGHTVATSTTACDSMEDEDDEKSENYSWKGHVHNPGHNDVYSM